MRVTQAGLFASSPVPVSGGAPPAPPPELLGETEIILNAETTGLAWWASDRPIGWSYYLPKSGRSGYLPMRHDVGENLPVETVHDFLRSLRSVKIDNTNTKFDLHMSRADGVDLVDGTGNTFGDVSHRAALLDDHRMRFNLDQLSLDVLGWNVHEDGLGPIPVGIKHEGQFRSLPWANVAPYAVRNVTQVHRLSEAFAPRIMEEDLGRVLALEEDVLPAVVEMEKNGTLIDLDLLDKWKREVDRKVFHELPLRIFRATGRRPPSPDSSKELEHFFKARGVPITSFTETGAPSFSAAAMKTYADPAVADILEWGQLLDLKSKYLDKYAGAVDASGWLRFNLHQLRSVGDGETKKGTVSGRFSAAGDKLGGYNPQQVVAVEKQLERGWCPDYVVRKLIVPATGATFFAADMMQVEYRLFAHYAASPKILATYAADPLADYHAVVMKLLHTLAPWLNRKLVKNVNFAKIYGAGLIKFALMLGQITEAQFVDFAARMANRDWSVMDEPALQEAKKLNAAYAAMFPEVGPLLKKASQTAEQRGYVMDFLGRRARLDGRFHSALNRVIQGGAATWNKRVIVEVYKNRKLLDFLMRLTIHDELAGDVCDPSKLPLMQEILDTQYYPVRVPILWDAKTGSNWAACK